MEKLIVCIVDDNPDYRKNWSRWLNELGFSVIEAFDGKHAYDKLTKLTAKESASLAVIITDENMKCGKPERENGSWLISQLASNEQLKTIPVIWNTGAEHPKMQLAENVLKFKKLNTPGSLLMALKSARVELDPGLCAFFEKYFVNNQNLGLGRDY
ncbi:MAG: response regulator [Hyphomicrobiales bacterium]|nr:response regulator [Rickettsiales bacterium]MCP5361736.1 response regulator [Hyphomicrobiales bacterium]